MTLMDIEIFCNTPDEVLFANIAINSARALPWIKSIPTHDGHAVIVGGGPSVADRLSAIKARIDHGQHVFALNGACGFLNRNGILPDFQVMVDARPENVNLLGEARKTLLASQCDPRVFDAAKNVRLWHPVIDGIADRLPVHDDAYALVGGGTCVGLSAMCLAYIMGYRQIHLYGYDCSFREDKGHAYTQPQNATEPVCNVTVGGKTFKATITMAQQAELFPECVKNLSHLGCTITVEAEGLIMAVVEEMGKEPALPEVLTEADKYAKMWSLPSYRHMSPGENFAQESVQVCGITADTKVIDFGCGAGRGGQEINVLTGAPTLLVDFAANCLDPDVNLPFMVADLTQPMFVRGDLGYCTDVMEHIPPEQVPMVIKNIMACVDGCFFKIARFPDHMGALIGQSLHLSVFDPAWWEDKFADYEIVYRGHDKDGEFPYSTLYVRNPSKGH